ncbi:MAG: hypothetical protein RSD97_08230 [Lachnospiraceae bacterium]
MKKQITRRKRFKRIKQSLAFIVAVLLVLNTVNFPAYATNYENGAVKAGGQAVRSKEVIFQVAGQHLVGDFDDTVQIEVYVKNGTGSNLVTMNSIATAGKNLYKVALSEALDTANTYTYKISSVRYGKAAENEFTGIPSNEINADFDLVSGNSPVQKKVSGSITDSNSGQIIPDITVSAAYADGTMGAIESKDITYNSSNGLYSVLTNINRKINIQITTKAGYDPLIQPTEVTILDADLTTNIALTRMKSMIQVTSIGNGSVSGTDKDGTTHIATSDVPSSVPVLYGENQTFTITPSSRYEIKSLKKDGAAVDLKTELQNHVYTLQKVTKGASLAAEFTPMIKFDKVVVTPAKWTDGKVKITGEIKGIEKDALGSVIVQCLEEKTTGTPESVTVTPDPSGGDFGTFEFAFQMERKNAKFDLSAVDPKDTSVKAILQGVGPVQIDKVKPVIEQVTPLNNTGCFYQNTTDIWVKNGATIQVLAKDEDSGMKEITFSDDKKKSTTYSYTGTGAQLFVPDIDTQSTSITVSGTDQVGNTSSTNQTFKVDNIKPAVAAVTPKSWYPKGQPIEIDNPFTDKESGLKYYRISYHDGGSDVDIQAADIKKNKINLDVKRFTQASGYKCTITAYDNLENWNTTGELVFKVDREVPTVTFSYERAETTAEKILRVLSFGAFANDNVRVTATGKDDGLGFTMGKDQIGLSYDNVKLKLEKETVSSDKKTLKSSFILELNDIHKDKLQKIQADVTDDGENKTTAQVNNGTSPVSFMLEKTAPEMKETVTYKETKDGAEKETTPYTNDGETWCNQDTKVSYVYKVKDLHSGLYRVEASINGKALTFSNQAGSTYLVSPKPEFDQALATEEFTYSIPVSRTDADTTGKCEIKFNVIDNAGNALQGGPKVTTVWFDQTKPEVLSCKYEPNKTFADFIWGILSFGTYSNQDMKVTVTAADKQSGFQEAKGSDQIQLYYGKDSNQKPISLKYVGSKVSELDGRKNGQIVTTYVLEYNDINKAKFDKIQVLAKDNVNNVKDTFVQTDTKDIQFMLEKNKPAIKEIKANRDFSTKNIYYEDLNQKTKVWCDGQTKATYEFQLKDTDSGLNDVEIKINQGVQNLVPISVKYEGDAAETTTNLMAITKDNIAEKGSGVTKYTKKIVEATYRVPVELKDADLDTGAALIDIQVKDNAQNVETYHSKGQSEIWFDDQAPTIPVDTFTFTTTGKHVEDESPVHVYNQIGSGVNFAYFFENETKVSFRVIDYARNNTIHLGSQIQNVQYRLKPFTGQETKGTIVADTNGNCQVIVPQNFKGEVFVQAIDHVNNDSGEKHPNGIVLEDALQHIQSSASMITLPATSHRDALGNPLYAEPQVIGLALSDTHSGIRKMDYTYKSYYRNAEVKHTEIINEWDPSTGNYNGSKIVNGIGLNLTKEGGNSNLYVKAAGNQSVSENANNICLDLALEDRVGFSTKAEQKRLSIDTIAPVVDVTWDNHDVRNEKYYKADRTATITVKERNFNPEACKYVVTGPAPAISGWTHVPGGACNGSVHTDECVYKSTVTFSQDGDYTFTFATTDLAGHSSVYSTVDTFTLDKTLPLIKVSYDNNSARNGMYYKAARTGTISITEHNFRGSDVKPTISATNGGTGIAAPGVNGWSTSGDNNTATVGYTYDGDFTFDVAYEDLAGNIAADYTQDRFIVDLTVPKLELYDITDKSANNNVVAPGVRYSDTNVDGNGVAIDLTGANHGAYKMDGNKVVSSTGVDLKLYDFPRQQEIDDLYTMKAIVNDMAGNQSEQTVMFSVNRFGSVYILSEPTKKLVKNKFAKKEQDIMVTEINVDTLEKKELSSSCDGELKKLTEKDHYKVAASGNEESWKRYLYTIDKENFVKEGNYTVTLYSEDRATNTQNNKIKEKDIEFVIDKTNPSAVISGVTNHGQYRSSKRTVIIDVQDNILLTKAIVVLNGKETTYKEDDIDKNNGVIKMDVDSSNTWQDIKVVSLDAAGNQAETKDVRFLITTNLLVQFISNKPILYGSIGGVVILGVGLVLLLGRRKKN